MLLCSSGSRLKGIGRLADGVAKRARVLGHVRGRSSPLEPVDIYVIDSNAVWSESPHEGCILEHFLQDCNAVD